MGFTPLMSMSNWPPLLEGPHLGKACGSSLYCVFLFDHSLNPSNMCVLCVYLRHTERTTPVWWNVLQGTTGATPPWARERRPYAAAPIIPYVTMISWRRRKTQLTSWREELRRGVWAKSVVMKDATTKKFTRSASEFKQNANRKKVS